MAFKVTEWAHQNMEIPEPVEAEAGVQYLSIQAAAFNEDTGTYSILFKSLSNEALIKVWYKTIDSGDNGFITPNVRSRQTLVTLGTALAGTPIGIPNPVDIVGGVVMANVILNPSKTNPDKKFTNIYSYEPVPEDLRPFATIDQYFTPAEDAAEEPSEGEVE
jgi:hypothetical protein